MRGKRSKQYKKLMQQYGLVFGFREPYQVLVDAQMIQDADRFKMDLTGGLERVLHGKVKPMITQCSIRHLYTLTSVTQSQKEALILRAKGMERRRCNHHTLEQPLSTLECLSSVVDPKGSRTNKNRYIVASQEEVVRKYCRAIKGVPLVYIKRSVMVMEPMADSTLGAREGFEKGKFRAGIRGKDTGIGHKRKRAEDESSENEESGGEQADEAVIEDAKADGDIVAKKKKSRGPKGPNPLSVRKPQNRKEAANMVKIHGARGMEVVEERAARADKAADIVEVADVVEALEGEQPEVIARRKRKRKHKPSGLKELLQVGGIDEESS